MHISPVLRIWVCATFLLLPIGCDTSAAPPAPSTATAKALYLHCPPGQAPVCERGRGGKLVCTCEPISTEPDGPVCIHGVARQPALVGGWFYECALGTDGADRCWGYDPAGDGAATLSPVTRASGLVGVAAGGSHACDLNAAGIVSCWGNNWSGQLGDGVTTTVGHTWPVPVVGLSGATAVAASADHACAVWGGGLVSCWGANDQGQLGGVPGAQSATPLPVTGISGAVALSRGGDADHVCALLADGTLRCWGDDRVGQLGDGPATAHTAPAQPVGLANVIAVSAGGGHTCALDCTGALWCWGSNDYGELGDGTTTARDVPTRAAALVGDFLMVGAADDHTCALRADGLVFCWGYNGYGTSGTGDTTSTPTPRQVSGLTGVDAIDVERYRTCAHTSAGSVFCWGTGPLGNGTFDNSVSPVLVTGLP